jgi:hypothetical protein
MAGTLPFATRLRLSLSPSRKAQRAHLQAARLGDREQYLALAANYLDLTAEFLGGTLSEDENGRLERVEQIFAGLWRRLRFAERLSDFEYMLARALLGMDAPGTRIRSANPLVTKLRVFEPRRRFAFIAYECEHWPIRWVALALRIKETALHALLSAARCELCGVSWESLTPAEQDCLLALSRALDGRPDVRTSRALSKRLARCPRAAGVRAEWLELRSEVVEVRHRYRPDEAHRAGVLGSLLEKIENEPMQRPMVMHRLFNTLRFSRHPEIKVS